MHKLLCNVRRVRRRCLRQQVLCIITLVAVLNLWRETLPRWIHLGGDVVAASVGITSTIRVVAMSDTHGFHRELSVPEGDILVHCGDAYGDHRPRRRRGPDAQQMFADWFRKRPHQQKIFVAGNHEEGAMLVDLLGDFVLNGTRECFGLRVHAVPYHRKESGYKLLPEVDMLLSHEPPFGTLDLTEANRRTMRSGGVETESGQVHIGSQRLRHGLDALANNAPWIHIFGHIHEGRGIEATDDTLYVNAANANPGRAKRLDHGCVVLEISERQSDSAREFQVVAHSGDGPPCTHQFIRESSSMVQTMPSCDSSSTEL